MAEDKVTRLINAQWTFVSRRRHGAGFKQWTTGLPDPARRGGFLRDEPQNLFNDREP